MTIVSFKGWRENIREFCTLFGKCRLNDNTIDVFEVRDLL